MKKMRLSVGVRILSCYLHCYSFNTRWMLTSKLRRCNQLYFKRIIHLQEALYSEKIEVRINNVYVKCNNIRLYITDYHVFQVRL